MLPDQSSQPLEPLVHLVRRRQRVGGADVGRGRARCREADALNINYNKKFIYFKIRQTRNKQDIGLTRLLLDQSLRIVNAIEL